MILRLAVLVEVRLVTDTDIDRQTDTDTGPWLVYRECIASRGKNLKNLKTFLNPKPPKILLKFL